MSFEDQHAAWRGRAHNLNMGQENPITCLSRHQRGSLSPHLGSKASHRRAVETFTWELEQMLGSGPKQPKSMNHNTPEAYAHLLDSVYCGFLLAHLDPRLIFVLLFNYIVLNLIYTYIHRMHVTFNKVSITTQLTTLETETTNSTVTRLMAQFIANLN